MNGVASGVPAKVGPKQDGGQTSERSDPRLLDALCGFDQRSGMFTLSAMPEGP